MTDLLINAFGDLELENGQLKLVPTTEELTQQRLKIHLNTFTKTWFANQNFGINSDLMFQKGTKAMLDQDIKEIIGNTQGVVRLVSYESTLDSITRKLSVKFKYEVVVGGIDDSIAGNSQATKIVESIFQLGTWTSEGAWGENMIWGQP